MKAKDDDKDRYRPKKKLRSKGYYKSGENLELIDWLKNLTRSTQPPQSRPIVDLLLHLADKGVNLVVIDKVTDDIFKKYGGKTGLYNMTKDLPYKKETIDRIHAIRRAAAIIADLKPVFQGYAITEETNEKLHEIQIAIKQILNEYCAFSLYQEYLDPLTGILFPSDKGPKLQYRREMELQVIYDSFKHDDLMKILIGFRERSRRKKTTDLNAAVRSMHGIWDKAVKSIVDEIKRAGCESQTECFKITAKILHSYFPDIYQDDWKLVRATYLHTSSKKV